MDGPENMYLQPGCTKNSLSLYHSLKNILLWHIRIHIITPIPTGISRLL